MSSDKPMIPVSCPSFLVLRSSEPFVLLAYGLAAALFTQDLTRAIETGHKLQAGTVWVSDACMLALRLPSNREGRSTASINLIPKFHSEDTSNPVSGASSVNMLFLSKWFLRFVFVTKMLIAIIATLTSKPCTSTCAIASSWSRCDVYTFDMELTSIRWYLCNVN